MRYEHVNKKCTFKSAPSCQPPSWSELCHSLSWARDTRQHCLQALRQAPKISPQPQAGKYNLVSSVHGALSCSMLAHVRWASCLIEVNSGHVSRASTRSAPATAASGSFSGAVSIQFAAHVRKPVSVHKCASAGSADAAGMCSNGVAQHYAALANLHSRPVLASQASCRRVINMYLCYRVEVTLDQA